MEERALRQSVIQQVPLYQAPPHSPVEEGLGYCEPSTTALNPVEGVIVVFEPSSENLPPSPCLILTDTEEEGSDIFSPLFTDPLLCSREPALCSVEPLLCSTDHSQDSKSLREMLTQMEEGSVLGDCFLTEEEPLVTLEEGGREWEGSSLQGGRREGCSPCGGRREECFIQGGSREQSSPQEGRREQRSPQGWRREGSSWHGGRAEKEWGPVLGREGEFGSLKLGRTEGNVDLLQGGRREGVSLEVCGGRPGPDGRAGGSGSVLNGRAGGSGSVLRYLLTDPNFGRRGDNV